MLTFDTSELNKFEQNILDIAQKELPREAKKFLRDEGGKLRKATLAIAKQRVKKKTGNYYKSIKRGKLYKYHGTGDWSIRAYSGAPHAHLIEDGHRQVSGGKEQGFVSGKHVFEDAAKGFEGKHIDNARKFVDKVLDKGW